MSRRKTVKLNMGFCLPKIKEVCRSNIVFCEKMGRGRNWVTEWKRNRNLPSPEEAARMCVILQVRPEEILTEQDDIELVSKLLESQKEKPLAQGEGQIHAIEDWDRALTGLSQDELRKIMDIVMRKFAEGGK